jgi:uncharacterized protein
MRDDDDRVLAVMTKAPRAGHVKTRLAGAGAADAIVALYKAFVEDTIDLARSLALRIVAVCPAGDEPILAEWLPADVSILPQRGTGLAAGLASTFEQLCTVSSRRVVAFNADTPHVAPALLASAFDALASHDIVVGPCDDGGYYLVGGRRSYPTLFDAGVMGKSAARDALLAEATRLRLSATLIAENYDVDVPADVVRLARELAAEPGRAPRTAAMLADWPIDGDRP